MTYVFGLDFFKDLHFFAVSDASNCCRLTRLISITKTSQNPFIFLRGQVHILIFRMQYQKASLECFNGPAHYVVANALCVVAAALYAIATAVAII